ncbi:hypothetical protein AVDCRST_MAG94-5603 [uncultured Leptolyngbya sp.]|uniref:Uncharacterized protein n=1 Tax=uncultured Leptolyngbya sp. TaxID=332963 RepID=A0A6J4NTS6_9CYAN|nr:hypothetical protein AVDCRST_MAG94-5603 [uncultured Leptolyngbya sp.]
MLVRVKAVLAVLRAGRDRGKGAWVMLLHSNICKQGTATVHLVHQR